MTAADAYRLAADGSEAALAAEEPSVRALLIAEAMRAAADGTAALAAERDSLIRSLVTAGRTCAEVGAMLDMSAANVSRISSRARGRLVAA